MRIAGPTLLLLSLCFTCGGGCPRSASVPDDPQQSPSRHPAYQKYRQRIDLFLTSNDYLAAREAYRSAADAAAARGDPLAAGAFRLGEAGAAMAGGHFRDALTTYLAARTEAERVGDSKTAQTAQFGLANLYMSFGDRPAALAAARQGLRLLQTRPRPELRFSLLLVLGRLECREHGVGAGEEYFREAIATGQELDDQNLKLPRSREGEAWSHFGYEALRSGNLDLAEEGFARGWRLRRSRRDVREAQSYPLLAQLYYARRRFEKSRYWIDRALENARELQVLQPWFLRYQRGLTAEALGQRREALADYRLALTEAREWRNRVLGSDRFRTEAEGQLSDLFDASLRVLAAMPESARLLREGFAILRESKAWSLQTQLEQSASPRPASHATELDTLRRLETRLLAADKEDLRAEAELHRLKLIEMEASAVPDSHGLSLESHAQLSPAEASLIFHTSAVQSQLWLQTGSGVRRALLPGRDELAAAAGRFRQAVEENSPRVREEGLLLLDSLLGPLRKQALSHSEWRLVLDNGLFDIPFAALSVNKREFLVENHTLLQVPNLASPAGTQPWSGSFLGLADPIMNRADPRTSSVRSPLPLFLRRFGSPAPPSLEFSSLPASLEETRHAASGWPVAEVLSGSEATIPNLLSRLRRRKPSILHLATHATPVAGGSAGLVFSLGPGGEASILGPRDVMALPYAPPVIVMSACHSGAGRALPGSGVLGLIRAWIAAGSRHVVATHWPVVDEAGPVVSLFYRFISVHAPEGRFSVAAALRQAQRECLRSPGVHSEPRYWSGFYIAGKG